MASVAGNTSPYLRIEALRRRLLAANLRSRSLRLTRPTRAGAFDLSRLGSLNRGGLDRLLSGLGGEEPLTVDLLPVRSSDEAVSEASEDLRHLSNAAYREWMEVGEDELLLGWPFVEGKLAGTWLRAPLLLFPVGLTRSRRDLLTWQLTIEGRPDANEVLAQALFRLAGIRLSLDRLVEIDEDKLLRPDDASWAALERWLAEGGAPLAGPGRGLPPLEPIAPRDRTDMDCREDGRVALSNHLALGLFPQSSSTVLSDYDELESRPELLRDCPAAELLAVDESVAGEPAARPSEPGGDSAREIRGIPAAGTAPDVDPRLLPSDASQEAVIRALDRMEGRGLVVRGPPGTGKSQLISNLVGRAIHRGERLLVVCQKRAAIDVVAQRLAGLGLAESLALVHDIHRDRRDFAAGLAATLERTLGAADGLDPGDAEREDERAAARFEAARKRFSARLGAGEEAYGRMTAEGPGGPCLAELFERALDDDGRELPDLRAVADGAREDDVVRALPDIETLAPGCERFAAPHPLAVRTDWPGRDEAALAALRARVCDLRDALLSCGAEGGATMTPAEAGALDDLWTTCAPVLDLLEGNDVRAQNAFAVFWTFTDAGRRESAFRELLDRLRTAREELQPVPERLFMASSDEVAGWIPMLGRLSELRGKRWRFLRPSFWRLRGVANAVAGKCTPTGADPRPPAVGDLVRLCGMTLKWHALVRDVTGLLEGTPFLDFGCRGQLEDIDDALAAVKAQQDHVEQIRSVHERLRSSSEDYALLPDLERDVEYRSHPLIRAALADRGAARRFAEARGIADSLYAAFRRDWLRRLLDDAGRGRPDVAAVDTVLGAWGESAEAAAIDRRQARLPVWAREFLRFHRPARPPACPVVGSFDAGGLAEDLRVAMERAWRSIALGEKAPAEAEAALVDESQRARLAQDYDALVASTGPAVAARYRRRLRRAASGTDRAGAALRKCLKDAQRKRNRLSIRQFVERYWDGCLALLRPVWLCSPESVAALFPLEHGLFDCVVMDEASQCPVESALPALFRGRRLVVAGDEKQMPPSFFFAARDDDGFEDDEEGESALLGARSILDVARVAYPVVTLRFHYRSRYEELITFSNHAFYGGGLVTAPATESAKAAGEGMSFEKVDGLWSEQTNEKEAARVVDVVLGLLGRPSADGRPPTVGVVTFNRKQRHLVERLLDERAVEDERARDVLAADRARAAVEALFVKNIENVQGDERDVIVFSVGYGPAEPGGRIHARFGPVGVRGGENRLNVAITRARLGVRVIASFEPRLLETSRTEHVGPKLLRAYLEYAKHASEGATAEIERVLREIEALTGAEGISRDGRRPPARIGHKVREALARSLESHGLEVARDHGIGPYRLDLAVRDPARGPRWSLGVDCTRFLLTADTVQRDVTEPSLWKRAGWTIFRVSPAMWLGRRDEVVAALVASATGPAR